MPIVFEAKRLRSSETGTGGRRWSMDRIDNLPDIPGVYVLFHQGKRIFINVTENLRKAIKQQASSSMHFTEFTWYATTLEYGQGLAKSARASRTLTISPS